MKKLDPLIWKNTFKWQYEAYPFFNSVYIKVAERTKNKYFMCADNFLTLFRGGFFIGLLPNQEVFYIGRKVIKESLKGKKDFLEEFKKVYGQIDVAVADCEEAIKKNNFADLNKWWFSTQTALSNVSHILFNFDYVFDEFLQDLQANNPEDKKALDFYIVSDTPSFFDKVNSRLLELNAKYPNHFSKVFKIFMAEFGWFQNTYKGVFKIDQKWLEKYFSGIKKEERKPKLSKNLTPVFLPGKYSILVEIAKLGITFRDNKKKLLLMAVDLMEKWLKGICSKKKWDFNVMRWLSMDEILNVLNNSENMYLKRTEQYAAADKRIGIMNAIGYEDVSEEFLEKVLALVNIDANIKEIKGLSGNKGLYKGIVKVVFDPRKELDKFNSGDVLVAPMTRPEYITLMKKAAAFVTDEGGITSHAAIISREIGIPCIIGTKIATQVLKDGDLVEVDADKGVVRILERAESKN